jgi:serine/threonine protein kinase/tetratricopeptide (TPR) repeat protein
VTPRIVAGRFELDREAGSGGMGTVYRARDLTDGSTVAVKILNGHDVRDRKRFDQEAAILSELSHPSIVRYVAHGQEETGDHFIAMEWLEGEDLAARLNRQALSVADSVFVIRRAAEALAYAHPRGIVHRDVKPENLFLPDNKIGRLKVLDFGIARLTRGGRQLTRTGSVIGTPGYMAPELVRGERDISACADVFSLGCVLFQCLTGRPVFEAEESSALLAKILLQDAPRVRELVPHLPDALDDLVASMLAKDPAMRLADAAAVLEGIDALGELGDVASGDRRRWPRPALTASEQRIACVVLAGASASDERRWRGSTVRISVSDRDSAETAGPPSPVDVLESDLARVYGARVHALPDGSMVLTLPEVGKSTDQAARAARCALTVRAALPDVPLVVSTGPGRFSAWSVVGEVIDSGMRLLRCTSPGMIRLDDMAAGLLDARFDIHRDGTTQFLRGERDVFEAKRNLLGKATDFVGRGREISMLTNLFSSTIAETMASAVLVTGAAGVGKSRLRQEFLEWVQRRPQRAEVLFGLGDSLGAGSPFGMLGRAIRRMAGIQDAEPPEEKRRKLSLRVARHIDRDSLSRVAAFIGEITGIAFPDEQNEALRAARQNPQLMGDGMRRAWEDWLAAECAAGPVLIVLEDLHWGDLGTVSFIDAALRNFREQPLMVLALARPDVVDRFPNLWQERELQTMRLAPLPKRAAEKLVREALGHDAGEAIIHQIIERADGNAFYLEELIRAAADGRCESLPDSVIGMVQARLDVEDGNARRVLRAASVFGERFSRGGVLALLGGETEAAGVNDWLDHLCARELVARVPCGDRSAAPAADIELTFSHALVREAAYAMLTDDDRTLGHRLAGDWLEQTGHGDAMALAEHFRRGDEPGRSVCWYQRAAEQALKANDLAAAIDRAELGMSAGAAGEIACALRLIQAEGHVWRGELALAEQRALDAAADASPGSALWLRAQGHAIVAAAKHGKLDEVEAQVRAVSDVVPDLGARSAQIVCLAWGANYLIFGGRYAVADETMAILAELAGDLSEIDLQAVALVHQVRSVRASVSGDLGACLNGLETALPAFEQAGDLRNACTIRCNMGYVYCELGDFERAEVSLRHALAAADRMGLHDLAAAILHNLGRVLGLRGNLDEARLLEQKAIDSFGKQGEPRLEGVARTYLAEILIAGGDFAGAEREAVRAIEILKVAPSLRVAALGALARALLGQGASERASETAREAFADLEGLGEIEEGEAAVRLVHAECLAKAGAHEQACAAIERAKQWLMARAARIGEASWRQRFLSDVPPNARILALADAWTR